MARRSAFARSPAPRFGQRHESLRSARAALVREGIQFIPDEDGLELPDIAAAEREAAEGAADIGRKLPKGAVTVEVRNERGQRVITATVTLALDRTHSARAYARAQLNSS